MTTRLIKKKMNNSNSANQNPIVFLLTVFIKNTKVDNNPMDSDIKIKINKSLWSKLVK